MPPVPSAREAPARQPVTTRRRAGWGVHVHRLLLAVAFLLSGGLLFLAGLLTGAGGLQRFIDVQLFDSTASAAPPTAGGSGASGALVPSTGAAAAASPRAALGRHEQVGRSPTASATAAATSAGAQAPQVAAQPSLPAPAAAPAEEVARSGASGSKPKYGFYLHVFGHPAAVVHQVRQLRNYFPGSPIYVMSDGGMDFGELCRMERCTFRLCPPANDRWHPWPFLRRFYDAAIALGTEYVIMLEPDNTVHGPIKRPPTHDAGGLYVKDRSFALAEYVEQLASKRKPGFKWTRLSMQAGLAGGSYFKREAILDAFSDETMSSIDWNYVAERAGKDIFSSDFAIQYALAARGWSIHPWEETAQMDKDRDVPLTGPKDAAFRHYCRCYPGGKPTYNLQLSSNDQRLVKPVPAKYGALNSVCQVCYNLSRYIANWGSAECTNRLPFTYSKLLMLRHHPELKQRRCDLPWLCEAR